MTNKSQEHSDSHSKFTVVDRLLLDIRKHHICLHSVGVGRWRWEQDYNGDFRLSSDAKSEPGAGTHQNNQWWDHYLGEQFHDRKFPIDRAYPYQPLLLMVRARE